MRKTQAAQSKTTVPVQADIIVEQEANRKPVAKTQKVGGEKVTKQANTKATTKVATKATTKVVEQQPITDVKKTSGRNFYAVKTVDGKDAAYAFETVAQRKRWMDKQEAGTTKEITAPDVYVLLQKGRNDHLCANRFNRVYVIESKDEVKVDKGQRLVM